MKNGRETYSGLFRKAHHAPIEIFSGLTADQAEKQFGYRPTGLGGGAGMGGKIEGGIKIGSGLYFQYSRDHAPT